MLRLYILNSKGRNELYIYIKSGYLANYIVMETVRFQEDMEV